MISFLRVNDGSLARLVAILMNLGLSDLPRWSRMMASLSDALKVRRSLGRGEVFLLECGAEDRSSAFVGSVSGVGEDAGTV